MARTAEQCHMKGMLLLTERREYRVRWRAQNINTAYPLVQIRTPILWGIFHYWKTVWDSPSVSFDRARRMRKTEMLVWFQSAVSDYERWEDSWSE